MSVCRHSTDIGSSRPTPVLSPFVRPAERRPAARPRRGGGPYGLVPAGRSAFGAAWGAQGECGGGGHAQQGDGGAGQAQCPDRVQGGDQWACECGAQGRRTIRRPAPCAARPSGACPAPGRAARTAGVPALPQGCSRVRTVAASAHRSGDTVVRCVRSHGGGGSHGVGHLPGAPPLPEGPRGHDDRRQRRQRACRAPPAGRDFADTT
jgi:hypothetical protein